jgi:hypothetical protein
MNDRALGEALSMPMAVGAVVANGPPSSLSLCRR